MELPFYQVDAFAEKAFEGNPAAICPLDFWLDDSLMQAIAMENNLSETAFFVKKGDDYELRWFTPTKEVDLCGHATLASAFVLFEKLGFEGEEIVFHTKSGLLKVVKRGSQFIMDFPKQEPVVCETIPQALNEAFSQKPSEVLTHSDYIVIFEDDTDIETMEVDLDKLKTLDLRGVCISAKFGAEYDFVSRMFAPNYGIDEDPVTGSAYTQLMPYWSQRLNKNKLRSKQVSSRGGVVTCELQGDRVFLSGSALCCIEGKIIL